MNRTVQIAMVAAWAAAVGFSLVQTQRLALVSGQLADALALVNNPPAVALAYTCGYRAGQFAIMSRLPSIFTNADDKINTMAMACAGPKATAARFGFNLP